MPARARIRPYTGRSSNCLVEPVAKPTDAADTLPAQGVHFALELWDDPSLEGVERQRSTSQAPILHEHEGGDHDQSAAVCGWDRDRISDEARDRLDLTGHDRNELAGRGT